MGEGLRLFEATVCILFLIYLRRMVGEIGERTGDSYPIGEPFGETEKQSAGCEAGASSEMTKLHVKGGIRNCRGNYRKIYGKRKRRVTKRNFGDAMIVHKKTF